jgi:phenylalanyl-tRNA synthetase beta chain
MIVSTDWLADYVDLSMGVEELAERLTLAGLNLEEFHAVGRDTAIDVEVTSNRPDCLGHIGVAREVAVLYGQQLKLADPRPVARGPAVAGVTGVTIECPDLCPRYTARVVRGVRIGPSPAWLADRLRTLGIAVINNVVDITNYVLMEIGQPLHAFDLRQVRGGRLVVRRAAAGEPFTAIDHKTYTLSGDEVVIADGERPLCLGGVMGGVDSEVTDATVDLLIESAAFAPLAVRAAARRHALHSPSSYRFERGVDPEAVDWASRRCCELILELAGGELCEGVIDVGAKPEPPAEVKLRWPAIPRLLGIDIPRDQTRRTLSALGCRETHDCDHCVKVVPPTWRGDLTREADLVEEVGRVHGYDNIPAETALRVGPSSRSREDLVIEQARAVLVGAGFDEAYTLSAVEPELVETLRPWTTAEPLATATPVLRRANRLRQSLLPSLLAARRTNETLSNGVVELFEVANAYLPREGALPDERRLLAFTSGGSFLEAKGVVEALVAAIAPAARLEATAADETLLEPARTARLALTLDGKSTPLGVIGELSAAGLERFGLRGFATVAEIDLAPLVAHARLVANAEPLSSYPPVTRDLNVVCKRSTRWADIERIAREAGGTDVERVAFQDDQYRDAAQIGEGNKSVVFRLHVRSKRRTMSSSDTDELVQRVVDRLAIALGATLRA